MFYQMPPRPELSDMRSVAIRPARPADAIALARLAALDSSRSPRGTVLLAEVDGELWAALGVDDGHAVADPFRPSREALALLRARAEHVRAERPRLAALRPRLAA
jgi:predicted methyltransferase MtxX (methanogen marker protein 4)